MSGDRDGEHRVVVSWSLVDGDVWLPVEEADWWGAAMSIPIAAIHHPQVLTAQQPDTDPAEVARQVLDELPELYSAAEAAAQATAQGDDPIGEPHGGSTEITTRGDGSSRQVVISPGQEVVVLCDVLEVFARAVLDPGSDDHRVASGGATAYGAAAWSCDLGLATGAIR